MIIKTDNNEKIKKLFSEINNSFILSAMQNIMGEIFADNLENPKSAMVLLGDFCFPAGDLNKKLLLMISRKKYIIIVPQNKSWEIFIENIFGDRAKKFTRYSMKIRQENFNKENLLKIISDIPKEYTLKPIDKEIFNKCLSENWSRDLTGNFKDYETFKNLGIGFVILKKDEIISGASSYSRYERGIEIQIDTKKDFRKKGLGKICGAKIILECFERNLIPNWDAHSKISMKLAEKLGYSLDFQYTAYEVQNF